MGRSAFTEAPKTYQTMNQTNLTQQALSTDTVFCRSLVSEGYLTHQQMEQAAQRYRLGRSKDGGVIFWQIDEEGHVRDGKIMFYRDDCHRDHDHNPDWVHFRLIKHYGYDGDIPVERCLFGLHLLSSNETSVVAVVESEKTAVILSEHFSQVLWLAAGGLTMLNAARLYPLRDRRVVLFPDTDPEGKAFKAWLSVAATAQEQFKYPIRVSRILEDRATPSQKEAKVDLVDYLFSPQTSQNL